jgi:hypothetical protein
LKIVLSHPCDRKKSHGWGTALDCSVKMLMRFFLGP